MTDTVIVNDNFHFGDIHFGGGEEGVLQKNQVGFIPQVIDRLMKLFTYIVQCLCWRCSKWKKSETRMTASVLTENR